MRKLIIVFSIILMITTAAANENVIKCESIPEECESAMNEELPGLFNVAKAMGMTSIDYTKINSDLSNVCLVGGFPLFHFDEDYLIDPNSGLNFYDAIDRSEKERRMYLLNIDDVPTILITVAKGDSGEWSVERFGEDATEVAKALKTLYREDSDLYFAGTTIYDRSGPVQRVIFGEKGKSEMIYKAQEFMKYVKESTIYLKQREDEKRKELQEKYGDEWRNYYTVGLGDFDKGVPKFNAKPYVETNQTVSYLGIAVIASIVVLGGTAFILRKRRKA